MGFDHTLAEAREDLQARWQQVVEQAEEARQETRQAAHALIEQLHGEAQAVRSELLQ